MHLLPVRSETANWTNDHWFEKAGHPPFDGCWICPGPGPLPEVHFQASAKRRGEPPPELILGSAYECHIPLREPGPGRWCRFLKRGHGWYLEVLNPNHPVTLQDEVLETGRKILLHHQDVIRLGQMGAYRVNLEENGDDEDKEDYPNRYPARFPCRSSLLDAPEAPEELRRLAWQTDQMRRRSENDQVRVADWSNFSQYVKEHYLRHGIQCTNWKTTGRGTPCDLKPPSLKPRPLPSWIARLLQDGAAVAGVDAGRRPLPFASALKASGVDVMEEPAATRVIPQAIPEFEIGGTRAAQEIETVSEPVEEVNPQLLISIREWLETIDDSLFMLQYYDQIVSNFDSLKQIHDIYFHDGRLDTKFFVAAGITKLGHKRIIEKWFRETC